MKIVNQISSARLNYAGDLNPVVVRLCKAYQIGELLNFSIIAVGYEDCNVCIETSNGNYVAKIFSKERSQDDIVRYSTIMEKALTAGVNHPQLMKTLSDEVVHLDKDAGGISMVLMKFISGKTFFELNRSPNEDELRQIIEQAVKINRIDYHPSYLFGSWAIPNINVMFDNVKQFISHDDLGLVKRAISIYEKIPTNDLPQCFVHGDFTKANVLKGDDGKIYILDFSVSNWYPRIQELAVISANLLHDGNDQASLNNRISLVLSEYEKLNPLNIEEKQYLYAYSLAGVAMEFMGAHLEKYIKGNDSKETDYWLNLGRDGLRRELIKSS